MAHNAQLSDQAANAAVNALCALLNSGFLDLYDGSQPANANTAVSTQTRQAHLAFGNPAFGNGVAGVATANAITQDSNAAGSANPCAWCRLTKADGSAVLDGSVGLAGCDLNLSATTITAGSVVTVTSLTITQPES